MKKEAKCIYIYIWGFITTFTIDLAAIGRWISSWHILGSTSRTRGGACTMSRVPLEVHSGFVNIVVATGGI
jgi:hypothetical protein